MEKVIRIKNLDCAACAMELTERLKGIDGIAEAYADFINQRVSLTYDSAEALDKAIHSISHFEKVEIVDGNAQGKESHLKEILSIAISAVFFLPALILQLLSVNRWVVFALFLCSFLAAGWSVVLNIFRFRGIQNILDENLLMTLASIGAFAIGEPMEGAAVMLLYQIGELLQSIAVGSSRREIKKLLDSKSEFAILLDGENERKVDPETLKEGDRILLRKGDKVPADCILEGECSLDTKSITGEAYLKEAGKGEIVLSGCVNAGNPVEARVLRPASESAAQKILDLVENSSAKKAKPEKFITKFARIYTPIVVLCALLILLIPTLIFKQSFQTWLIPAIEFLVISCPCALIISVPLSYFAGVGALAKRGVLTKGAVYLDELSKVSVALFDKTGTLTEGKFSIRGGDREAILLAAALERSSSHPLAQAFSKVETFYRAECVEEFSGMGLSAIVEERRILVGNAKLMQKKGIPIEEKPSPYLTLYVAADRKLVGKIEIEDKLKEDANLALSELKKRGIRYTAVLTGDTALRAKESLSTLPLDEIYSDLLPEEKLIKARELKARGKTMYLGDGVNDTPVLAESDVSIAMGGLGSDATIEASDFVLMGNLSVLPKAIKGAKKTRRIVKENIVFSIAVKLVLMALSLSATVLPFLSLPIWAAVFGDVGVMLLSVLNSLRVRRI